MSKMSTVCDNTRSTSMSEFASAPAAALPAKNLTLHSLATPENFQILPDSLKELTALFGDHVRDQLVLSAEFKKEQIDTLSSKFIRELREDLEKSSFMVQEPERYLAQRLQEFVRDHTMPSLTDKPLVFMERFEPLVKWMAIQRFPNDFHKVEDLTQEIIFKLHLACSKYDPIKGRASTFVMLIAKNHLIDSLRRDTVLKKVAPRSGPPIEECGSLVNHRETSPVVLVGQREQADRVIKKAENLLSQNQLEVIKGLYLEGKTLRELAKERKKPEGTVKSLLNRALRILRKHFNEVAD